MAKIVRFLIVVAVLLLPAGSAWATSCSGDCEGTDCNGGCTVNSANCSTACLDDGCPGKVLCKEYGGASHECTHEFTMNCTREQQPLPIPGPEQQLKAVGMRRSADWTVVAYETDNLSPMGWGDLQVLASSNRYHAERVVDELISRQREESGRLLQRVFKEGLRVEDVRSGERRLLFSVSPAAGCVRATLELEDRQLGPDVPERATVFVRATVDSKGRIVAVELLHSEGASGAENRMVDLLKSHGLFSRTDGGDGPYEAYVALYSAAGGSASWIVAGSKSLL